VREELEKEGAVLRVRLVVFGREFQHARKLRQRIAVVSRLALPT